MRSPLLLLAGFAREQEEGGGEDVSFPAMNRWAIFARPSGALRPRPSRSPTIRCIRLTCYKKSTSCVATADSVDMDTRRSPPRLVACRVRHGRLVSAKVPVSERSERFRIAASQTQSSVRL